MWLGSWSGPDPGRGDSSPATRSTRGQAPIESALLLVVLVRGVGVAQVADGARGQVREGESIGPVDAQVPAHERGEPGHVLIEDRIALGPELGDRGVQVHRGPQDHAIQDESEHAELIFEPSFVAVEQLALLAVADGAGQVVAAFLQVADVLDVAAIGLVGIDVGQDVQRLEDPAVGGVLVTAARRTAFGCLVH